MPLLMIAVGIYNGAPIPGCPAWADTYLQSGEYCYRARVTIGSTKTVALNDYPVRVQVPAQSLVQGGFTKDGGWDLRPFNVSIQDVGMSAQDMASNSAGWWVDIDAVASDGLNPVNWSGWLYTGNPYIQRDQGITMIGSPTDSITVTDHSELDFTDNFQIEVSASVLTDQTQTGAYWVNKLDVPSFTGYSFGFDNGNVVAKVGNGSVINTVSGAWDGAHARFRMTYDNGAANKLVIEKFNPATEVWDSLATGGSITSVSTNSQNLTIGDSFTGVIYQVAVFDGVGTINYWKRAEWGFNPLGMTETSSVNPTYTGTIADMINETHTATYSFARDQTDFSYEVGPVMPIFTDPSQSVPERFASVLGDPTQTDLFTTSPTNVNMPFYSSLAPSIAAMGIPANAFWVMFFGGVSGLLAIAVYMATRRVEIAMVVPGAGLLAGSFMGLLAPWITMLYGIAALALWMIGRWATE